MKKYNLFLFSWLLVGMAYSQNSNNLLPVDDWEIGNAVIPSFSHYGPVFENNRDLGIDPHGETSIIWTATASGDGDADGGWIATFPIDHTKTYRYVQWIKKNTSNSGITYLGASGTSTSNLDGTPNTNPYFWSGDLPELGKWYLLVGYMHGSSYTGTESIGGIYDGETGEKVIDMVDYKNKIAAVDQRHRAYFVYCTEAGVTQDYWGPRAEIVNGNEPTIEAMLGLPPEEEEPEVNNDNLLPIEDWVVGNAELPPFIHYGLVTENIRDFGFDPHGETSILWTATPSGDGEADGGWYATFPIDHTKTYRFVQWIKKNTSSAGITYLGAGPSGNTLNLDNNMPNTNPYFWYGDLPELEKWYMLVGYVHGSAYTGTESIGGIYDGETGEKVIDMIDFKNSTTAVAQQHRAYLAYCLETGVTQNYWGARAEAIDGNEPTIEALLGIFNGPHVWSEITEGAVYNTGSVGIGVDENDMDTAYKLLVDGDIKTRKVKVTLDGWADHVFDDDYELVPLEEVAQYIAKHKHLPGIPSESEVLEEGLYLGEANALLLQKIEELTLYSIEMKKEMDVIKKAMELLRKENEQLKSEE